MTAISRKQLRIALVGCGAVVEHRHLPALARRNDCQLVALVDANSERTVWLSKRYRATHLLRDHQDLHGLAIDAAIVALPNYLHAAVSIDLLAAGISVLVEKPMALSSAECDAMIQAAEAAKVVLAVGLTRRFMYAGRFVKWAVSSGLLGRIISCEMRDGFVFNWPLTSDFFFRKEAAGGGVLMDNGVHVLDQLLWWLGDVSSFEYRDDSYGGVEADCELHLTFGSGAAGTVELSRTRNLRNTAIIRGEQAELEVGLYRNHLALRFSGSPIEVTGQAALWRQFATAGQTQVDMIAAEHDDFVEAICTERSPAVSGAAGKRSIALIEACYQKRRPLQLPWLEIPSAPSVEEAR